MSIWGMPSVEDQPMVTLIRWRILRLKAKKVSIDLVLGWCIEDGHARMSTPIKQFDVNTRALTTKSGRIYVVEGPSDYDDDSYYILEEHFGRAAGKALDVSAEYFNEPLAAELKHVQKSEQRVVLNPVVGLSGDKAISFIVETDKPFHSNAKLTKSLKRQQGPESD